MLSIIIVNYNVKYFLEQCLYSLQKSTSGIEAEIIVMDNGSTDDSIEYLAPKFAEVNFFANNQNLGFAKACNKGLSYAKGKYILFLNPDTILEEDSLLECIRFFEKHPDAGAVGVKMVDGSGKFLKESKRAFPSPLTSMFKLFGLTKIFPRSKLFSRYYLGHLSENTNQEVDVLAGAFMMIRKEVLDKTGAFDEAFFMYGEDIDLSYRIQKSGYKNYYLATTIIIHFKGESTKRGSLNYVRMFYAAMSIFVKKHYGGSRAGFFHALLHFAIWLRAFVAAGAKAIRWAGLPIIDALIIFFSFWLVKEYWVYMIKPEIVYPDKLLIISFPVYTIVCLLAAYYAGLYDDKTYKPAVLIRSMVIAIVVLLSGYALLPEQYRFSRGITLFGSLLAFGLVALFRAVLVQINIMEKPVTKFSKPHLLIVATLSDFEKTKSFIAKKILDKKVIGRVAVDEHPGNSVTDINRLNEVVPALGAKELIFSIGELSYKDVLHFISSNNTSLRLRFHAVGSCGIVGSDSETANGQIITPDAVFNLSQPAYRRIKRVIDLAVSFTMLLSLPIHVFFIQQPGGFLRNCLHVLLGKRTWVGYTASSLSLPVLRKAVIGADGGGRNVLNKSGAENEKSIDYWYAKNYEPIVDIRLIVKNYKHLGS